MKPASLDYYCTPGAISDPGDWGSWPDGLPADLGHLSGVVQGLLIHVLEARRYRRPVEALRRLRMSC